MIVIDCEQGSPEWVRARLGIPTASQFHRIITAKTLKPSSQRHAYMHELLAEMALGEPMDQSGSAFMERGSEMEEEAAKWFAIQTSHPVTQVGFVLHDTARYGCSPDRLVGDEGLLEIKCPSAKVHVGALVTGLSKEYYLQTQGQLLVTGRKWCNLLFYNPVLPSVEHHVERDSETLMLLKEALAKFTATLEDLWGQLVEKGVQPAAVREEEDAEAREAREKAAWEALGLDG